MIKPVNPFKPYGPLKKVIPENSEQMYNKLRQILYKGESNDETYPR